MRRLGITAVTLLITGCAAHGAVPLEESSGLAPEAVRELLNDKVYVHQGWTTDWVGARYFRPGGGSDFCGQKGSNSTWTVGTDARGRATYRLALGNKRSGLYVPHYDPDSGELKFRRRDVRSGRWVTAMRGWLQESWPRSLADTCPGLAVGVPVDERQTGTTLAVLRSQTPDAPLKGLAEPLPGAGSPEKAARGPVAASGIEQAAAPAPRAPSPEQQLSDVLVGRGEPLPLRWMGEGYADRRFLFAGDGNLVVVDLDGNLAPDEGFEGTWRWTNGHLEVRVAGDAKVHGIAWRELARELGVEPAMVGRAKPRAQ